MVKQLGLPFPGEVSTTTLARGLGLKPFTDSTDTNASPSVAIWSAEATFTNKWKFELWGTNVKGFKAPDAFFFRWDIKLKDYLGTPSISDEGAKHRVEDMLTAMGHPATAKWLHEQHPTVGKPRLPPGFTVPRIWFECQEFVQQNLLVSVSAEVDTASGTVKVIDFYDARAPFVGSRK